MYEKLSAELERQERDSNLAIDMPDTLRFNGMIDLRLLYATVRDEVLSDLAEKAILWAKQP